MSGFFFIYNYTPQCRQMGIWGGGRLVCSTLQKDPGELKNRHVLYNLLQYRL